MIEAGFSGGNKISEIKGRAAMAKAIPEVKVTQFCLALASAIRQGLQGAIGDKAKHFDVKVTPSELGFAIQVCVVDDIGKYIYYGTRQHTISSADAMPIGNGKFAMSVTHPGQEPMSGVIDNAITSAFLAVRGMM